MTFWNRALRWLGIELVAVSAAERLAATVGGGLSILLLLMVAHAAIPGPGAVAVVASMGASAVLLYAVPHGQLSQPWPVLAGNTVSAAIGVACARWIPDANVAAACAVGLSIGAMHVLRCIHPPGGATALVAVIGGPAVHALGFRYVLCPVLLNAAVMVALAVALNYPLTWRRYPAALRPPAPDAPTHAEVVAAVRSLDAFVDVSEDDLLRLVALLAPEKKAR